ncbi:hypothetical protein DFQ28_002150 [Apophysomyces sp. BC1034]|nr:hypothetical protein DFQ30_007611 [Apophysomyces sp. BC1015]KAG0179803.1 hypothetical protein DFQ29_001650 [Apophysomyces sp. BC1021]KAG0190371.1 hypothetical protein DFQ28_002150 [Apophysomyces sp. BC1034]
MSDPDTDSYAVSLRSNRHVVLGNETEEEARCAEQVPVILPSPRQFVSLHDQRVHMKQTLAAGFRLLAKFGWDEGVAGHMTVRDPEYPDLFWVNAFGQHFGQIKASDLVLVDHMGSIVRGQSIVNKAAFVIHVAVHQGREDVVCAVHTHSMYGKTFSSLGRQLLPITQDACLFYGLHGLHSPFGGIVFDSAEGERLTQALGTKNIALILQNHGLMTVGTSIEAAVWRFISMEWCCQSQLLAEAAVGLDNLKVISDEVAAETAATLGSAKAGELNFQPMYQMIVAEQPDCLE